MPHGDTRGASSDQAQAGRPQFNIKRAERILGKAAGADNPYERVIAVEQLDRLLREADMRFPDLLDGFRQAQIATEAAAMLAQENAELRERLARYEQSGGRALALASATDWADVDAQSPQEWARWALRERDARRLYLNRFEGEFLPSIAEWYGELTPRQAPVFAGIKASVTNRNRGRRS